MKYFGLTLQTLLERDLNATVVLLHKIHLSRWLRPQEDLQPLPIMTFWWSIRRFYAGIKRQMTNEAWNIVQHILNLAVLNLLNTLNLTLSCPLSSLSEHKTTAVSSCSTINPNPSCPKHFFSLALSWSLLFLIASVGGNYLHIFNAHTAAYSAVMPHWVLALYKKKYDEAFQHLWNSNMDKLTTTQRVQLFYIYRGILYVQDLHMKARVQDTTYTLETLL